MSKSRRIWLMAVIMVIGGCQSTVGPTLEPLSVPAGSPTAAANRSQVIAIAASDTYACAIVAGGAVKCWGDNTSGQLGDGTTTNRLTPMMVSGLSGATQVSVGGDYACALVAGGSVKCWGANYDGQLGDGTTTDRLTPVMVSGVSGARAVSGSCAIVAQGAVECWGGRSATPVVVPGISGATAISDRDAGTCAALAGGVVECWGASWGAIGNTPHLIPRVIGATAIASDGSLVCALVAGGKVDCRNGPFPNNISDFTGATAIALSGGRGDICALVAGGVECEEQSYHWSFAGLAGVTAFSYGGSRYSGEYVCAIAGAGVECEGLNSDGQLGNGTTTDSKNAPVTVIGLTAVTVPDAPIDVQATAGDASTLVSWSAPPSGGAAITGYTVTSSPDGKTCTTNGATNCVVFGLTNGTTYTFTVSASNSVGTGQASDPTQPVTPVAAG